MNIKVRFLSFLIVLPLLLFVIFFRKCVFCDFFYLAFLFAPFLAILAGVEYFNFYRGDIKKYSGFIVVALALLSVGGIGDINQKFPHIDNVFGLNYFTYSFLVIAIVFFIFFIERIVYQKLKKLFFDLGVVFSALFFIGFFSGFFSLVYRLPQGEWYIFYLLYIAWIYDAGALFSGKLYGITRLCYRFSEKKTYEGFYGGILFSLIFSFGFFLVKRNIFSFTEILILPVFISILSQIGDLIESAFKRIGNVKDSGRIIPGHGGIYDVFDGVIYTLPFYYFYLVLRNMI